MISPINQSSHLSMIKFKFKSFFKELKKASLFIGPGLMISVAYMDPGNYSTAVAAGSAYKYNLLFSIFLSNCLAVFLQVLSAKLGAVTGLDLAANCKANLPHRFNLFMYTLAEIAIIATDLAEVVGTAIALNILFKLPLFAGVIVTVIDVLIVLMAYRPNGPLLFIRIFESFVSILVFATVICFAIELYQVSHDSLVNFSTWEVFKGFLPNEDVVDMKDREGGNGLFLSLAILGATVMPHSLYLGSGLVQARLKDFDIKNGYYNPISNEENENSQDQQDHEDDIGIENDTIDNSFDGDTTTTQLINGNEHGNLKKKQISDQLDDESDYYRPSIHAIDNTMTYTIVELVISLFTAALFVNSAILIVAGATLVNDSPKNDHFKFMRDDDDHHNDSDTDSDNEDYGNADLFTIYHLLSTHLSPTAGFVFALALLCSGQSAGVVCTLAGQMISEGFLNWSLPPITRRLITRGLAIVPCLLVVSFAGREGLSRILNVSQVVLSVLLPIVSAPLIYFTCSKSIMRVPILSRDGDEEIDTISEFENGLLSEDEQSEININKPNFSKQSNYKLLAKFKSTEPAIRLQNLRNSHPCVGWEDDDDDDFKHHDQRNLNNIAYNSSSSSMNPNLISSNSVSDADDNELNIPDDADIDSTIITDTYRVKGYKDMSNGPLTSFVAILVWGFITCLNLFLIGSMLLGYDVPL